MPLREQLAQDLKEAMKAKDEVRRTVIRTLHSAIKNVEIDTGAELTNTQILDVLAKQAKQRRDSIEQFQAGNRPDLVELEQQELTVIEAYLPSQLSDEEITQHAEAAIAELGVSDMKGMGKVMGKLSQDLKGLADGKRISTVVRGLLRS